MGVYSAYYMYVVCSRIQILHLVVLHVGSLKLFVYVTVMIFVNSLLMFDSTGVCT